MVLPDTSVWVDFSRRGAKGRASELRDLLNAGEVATCGPVVAELLAGADGNIEERMWGTLSSLPWVELTPGAWREIAAAARQLRKAGRTLPLTDLTIAVAAARGDHALWTFDGDFERIGTAVDGLRLHISASAG